MKSFWKFLLFLIMVILNCGTNTDVPVFPIYSLITVGSPAIIDIKPISYLTSDNKIRIEFDIYYFVTNTQDEFIGYNLYITPSITSPDLIQAGIIGTPYLPNGHEPSFYHSKEEVSTNSIDIKIQRIPNLKPAPSEISFQLCERYYFYLKAVLRNGITSSPGPVVSSCAVSSNVSCPSDTPCYGN